MKTFNIRTGTQIFSNDIEIILKRGVIHKNELIINIGESSKEFVEIFKELTEKNLLLYLPKIVFTMIWKLS